MVSFTWDKSLYRKVGLYEAIMSFCRIAREEFNNDNAVFYPVEVEKNGD